MPFTVCERSEFGAGEKDKGDKGMREVERGMKE